MSERTATRRTVLKATGAALAAASMPATAGASDSGDDSSGEDVWTAVESPTGNTLHDVEETTAGAYAVGGGGVVLERTPKGWRKVLDGGPTGNGNSLFGADVTDDGQRLWFVGSSGAIGEYDVTTGDLTDHSAPMDVTNNFNDVSVTGEAGEANVYVAGDSGKMYYSFENGAPETWECVTPASGSNVNAVDFYDDRQGHIVDGNKTVLSTADGSTWEKLGIENANYNFYGVDSDGSDDVWVAGGGGSIYRWNGSQWVRRDTGDASLRDVEVDGGDGLAVGGGGNVYARGADGWVAESTPTGQNLKAVVRADPAVAVGAGGTIVEK